MRQKAITIPVLLACGAPRLASRGNQRISGRSARSSARSADGQGCRLGQNAHRRFRAGEAGSRRPAPAPPADKDRAAAAALLRPDRPAADARGGRCLPRRRLARRLREGRRPLLASPHYGERWGRHWLDLVRYAETNGYERDAAKPHAWRYRDYVIRASTTTSRTTGSSASSSPATSWTAVTTETRSSPPATTAWASGTTSRPTRSRPSYDELDDIVATTGQVVPRPDGQLRPLPRPQDRPVPAGGLLPPAGVLPRRPALRQPRLRAADRQRRSIRSCKKDESPSTRSGMADAAARMKAIEDALRPHLDGGENATTSSPQNRLDIVRKHVPHTSRSRTSSATRQPSVSGGGDHPVPHAQACVTEVGRTPRETFVSAGNPRRQGDRVAPAFPSCAHRPAEREPPRLSGRRRRAGRLDRQRSPETR